MLYLIAMVAALAGLLFGYDAGIISGAILFIKKSFAADPEKIGYIVAAVPFGALCAAAFCGRINDLIGRKFTLIIAAIMFMAGSIVCAYAPDIDVLVIGRVILGLAVGLGSFTAPIYIAEIAREQNRGALVTLNQLAITIGILLSYGVDYHFAATGDWRSMLGFGFVPAVPLLLCVLFLPYSPRWLVSNDRYEEAKKVLTDIHGEHHAQVEMAEIESVIGHTKMRLRDFFAAGFLRVLMLGIMVSVFTQAIGINAIIYYAPTIFQLTGASEATSSILATVGIGVVNVLFTIVAIFLFDRLGRRFMLLGGLLGIIASLVIVTVAFSYGVSAGPLAWITLLSCVLFVAFQAMSTGPSCWLIPSEIFPTRARGVGMGLSVASNWGTNVLVAFFFPIMLQDWGTGWSFATFLIIAIVAWVLFYLFVPEAKGVSLEKIEANIVKGLPLRELGR